MKRYHVSFVLALLVLAALLAACGNQEATPPPEEVVVEADVPEEPVVEEPPAEPEPTPVPEIVHMTMPEAFQQAALQRIFDCDTSLRDFAGNLTLSDICDRWPENYLERPMTEEEGEYHPELDILQVEFGRDDAWFYVRLYMNPTVDDADLTALYYVEIDTDLDGRGDVLLLVSNPAQGTSGEWNVAGVQVWQDQNGDVGGETAVLADGSYSGDGYETLLFDAGAGNDPDLAWARVSTEVPGLIEFAFKPRMIDDTTPFAWWAGAFEGDLPIGGFDLVDSLDEETAFLLDNTCGWIFGSSGRSIPNLCAAIAMPTAEACSPPPGGCNASSCLFWDQASCSCVYDYSCFN